jgi:general secretion pathway protein M
VSAYAASRKAITTSPMVATAVYVGLVSALLFVTVTSIADVLDQRSQVAASSAMLEQLEGRRPAAAGPVT